MSRARGARLSGFHPAQRGASHIQKTTADRQNWGATPPSARRFQREHNHICLPVLRSEAVGLGRDRAAEASPAIGYKRLSPKPCTRSGRRAGIQPACCGREALADAPPLILRHQMWDAWSVGCWNPSWLLSLYLTADERGCTQIYAN